MCFPLKDVFNALAQYFSTGDPKAADIENNGNEDAEDYAEPRDIHCSGEPPGNGHHSEGEGEEGNDIL